MEKTTEHQKREELLLGLGRTLLVEHGFVGLQMDSIASRTNFSRATLYKHFRTKEDLASKIVLDSARLRLAAIDKAHQFSGSTRERLLALLMAEGQFSIQNPDRYPSELILRVSGILAGMQPESKTALCELDIAIASRFQSVIAEAICRGDLPTACDGKEILDCLMAMRLGTQVWKWLSGKESSANPEMRTSAWIQRMLDGLQWRPLVADWPYEESTRRILAFLDN